MPPRRASSAAPVGSHALALLLLCAGGCADPSVLNITRVYGPSDGDTYPLPVPLRIAGNGVLLRASEIELLTWPEYDGVSWASVEVGLQPGCEGAVRDDCSSFAVVNWSAAEAQNNRWYAVRWAPSSERPPVEQVFGIPLADGSYVWRVYRGSHPAIEWIGLDAASLRVYAVLNEEVRLVPGHPLSEFDFVVTQAGATCNASLAGETYPILAAQCGRGFDAFAPIDVSVADVWESLSGVRLPPLEISIDLEPGDSMRVDLDSDVPVPPPVPMSLCAGVECA